MGSHRKLLYEMESHNFFMKWMAMANVWDWLYGSETWCLLVNKVSILRTEKAMVRAMRGVKLMVKKKLMNWWTCVGRKGNCWKSGKRVGWYRHVLRDEDDALRKVIRFKVEGQRKWGRDDHKKHGGSKKTLEGLGGRRKSPLINEDGEMQ